MTYDIYPLCKTGMMIIKEKAVITSHAPHGNGYTMIPLKKEKNL